MTVYEKIEQLRKEKGFKKVQFIKECGMTSPGWYEMVIKDTMKLSRLRHIAKILGTTIQELLAGDNR